ncbi:MAG: DUF3368 domain-containing protein [Chloroflexi bacterium]|nr:MAG: DUF3368 domain-containing protein [Chloroflexota bacterium]
MIVVSNAGPLISLARAGYFSLLRDLFERMYIPRAVYEEVVVAGWGLPGSREVEGAVGEWIEVREAHEPHGAREMFSLGRGEAEAIALAMEMKADLVLLDDRKARRVAESLGLPLSGTLGVLRRAFQKGLIENWEEVLETLVTHGFWLGKGLGDEVSS